VTYDTYRWVIAKGFYLILYSIALRTLLLSPLDVYECVYQHVVTLYLPPRSGLGWGSILVKRSLLYVIICCIRVV